MKIPNVVTQKHDPKKNFTFRVRAYRELTTHELRIAFNLWNQQRDKRCSLRNKIVEVTSTIGYDE